MPANTKENAAAFVPKDRTLPVLREAVQKCRGCDLYRNATQAVFGELETGAAAKKPQVAIMMIGEQPGDHEDREGRPFVGPAGSCWINVWKTRWGESETYRLIHGMNARAAA